MSVGCKFYLDVQPEEDVPTTVRLKCSHAAGHSGEHRLGVNWLRGEKQKLKVPDLRPMDFFTLFGERYQVEATSGTTTVWARLTIASAGFDDALERRSMSAGWQSAPAIFSASLSRGSRGAKWSESRWLSWTRQRKA